MSKKLILFLMVLLFGSTSFLRAEEVQIGTGTTANSYLPSYSLFNYSLTQQIYTADEIGVGAGTINSIAFYNSGSEKTRTYDVYLVNTAKETFETTTDWVAVTATDLVFSGSVTMSVGAWTTFTLDTPFEYDGTNLLVVMDDNTGTWSSGLSCYVFDATSKAIRIYNDYTNYDPTNPAAYVGTIMDVKNQIVINIDATPVPPVVGGITILPEEFDLGYRPLNGWMESFSVKIHNGGAPTTVTASLSNTAGTNPFSMSETIDNVALDTEESIDFLIDINNTVAAGDYAEEFTLFYTDNRSVITVPVTSTFYQAGEADIVETAKAISLTYQDNTAEFSETPVDIQANYMLEGMEEMAKDAVYEFTIAKDSKVTINANGLIAIYNKVLDFHPSQAAEAVIIGENTIDEKTLLLGDYYMIVVGDAIGTITGTIEQIPAPTELIALAPANGATGIDGEVTLMWEGGENATQYLVLFGTSPTNLPIYQDWTMIDDNYGEFPIGNLDSNTQYFWQIVVKNTNGIVSTPRYGFTTTLVKPHSVTASAEEIFVDESTLIKWKHSTGTGFVGEVTVCEGTETNSYVPVYGLWVDDYTRSEMIYPAEMLEEMENGEITQLKYYLSTPASGAWAPAVFNVYMMEVDATTLSTYYTSADATIVYTGSLDGTGTTMTINLDTPYLYEGGNLLVGIEETVEGTYKSAYFTGITATGASASGYSSSGLASVTFNQRNFLPKTTFTCGDAKGTRDFLGYNVYYGDVKANTSLITEKQYLLGDLPYNMDGHDVTVTAVYNEGESELSEPVVVRVSGYGTFTGTVTELISGDPVAGVNVKFLGKDEFNNNVTSEGITDNNGEYTINNVKAGDYVGIATLEGMEPNISEEVTLAFEATENVDFVIHEEYKPVLSVYAEEIDPSLAKVQWSINTHIGGGGGAADEFTEGFENGMPADWTIIDANNDGYTWCMTSAIPTTWTYYAGMTLDWYRTGSNAICSGSYINGAGALNPDEYLVTPKVNIGNGSTFSFWAAPTDANYPADHFGVAVSDNGTDWTMINEWTLTAKSNGINGGRASRNGNGSKVGTWQNFSVDLSSYAGNKYIAIRHFNCYDQYIMCVDDIELSASKNGRAVEEYAVYRKAILKEEAITPADSVFFGTTTDTLYADFDWNNVEPGLYQYGVSAHYPIPAKGNRDNELTVYEGTVSNSYVPMYVGYFDDWSRTQYVIPAADLADMAGGKISAIKFYTTSQNMPYTTVSTADIYMAEVDYTTISEYMPKADAQVVFSGNIEFVAEGSGGMTTITFDTPYTYNGGNLLIGCENTTDAGYKFIYFYGQQVTGASISGSHGSNPASIPATQRNFIPQTTFVYTSGSGSNDNPITPITWSNYLPKDMNTVVVVNAHIETGSYEGAAVAFRNTFDDVVMIGEFDETGTIVFDEFSKGNYLLTATLEDFESNYNETAVEIWNDTVTFDVMFTEIFKPVESIEVSSTGFARWTNMLPEPEGRMAEKYHVTVDNVFQGETTDSFMQLENLVAGQTYTAAVAVVYTTGMSIWKTATFTYMDCDDVTTQVEGLEATNEPGDLNVILTWNGAQPTPPTPPTPPTGDVTITLTADDVWGDGSGYQMLLDDTHSLYGTTIPETGALSMNCSGNEAIYAQFSHKIPTNADGNCSTQNMVNANSVSITIPAGTYDWCITNPTPGDRIWIASSNGTIGGRYDDYTFESGYTYEFHVYFGGTNDATDLTISPAKSAQPKMAVASNDNRTAQYVYNPETVESCGSAIPSESAREMWDYVFSFNAAEAAHYGIATDGEQYMYTSNWGYSGATYNFYQYDMQGNVIEGFNISGCGTLRGMAYDGDYFYGVANSSTIYCVDLANHTLIGQTTTAYGAMRCITYDPVRDGFWVVGNWSGALTLVDRTGAIVQTAITPSSASDIAYYKDENNEEHVYVFTQANSDAKVYDYNITTNVYSSSPVFDMAVTPGYQSGSGSGGCFVGNYNGKTCFFGDVQQSPNLIGIYELGSATPVGPTTSITPNKFNIFFDGEIVGASSEATFTYLAPDYAEHNYAVMWVDANYNMSCLEDIDYAAEPLSTPEESVINAIYPNPTSADLYIDATAMKHISVYNAMGQMVYDQDVNTDHIVLNMAQYETGVYMINVITENGTSVKRITVTK